MPKLNEHNSQHSIMYSNGILTSLILPRKRSGCMWFTVIFLSCTLVAVVILSVVLFLNASKIFSNLGRYALTTTMQAIDPDASSEERTEFSNAYLKIFAHIEERGITALEPWTINAMTNLASSAKDHKISREECVVFIGLVENGSHSVTNKSGTKK